MGGYADVDDVINKWVGSIGSTLFTDWADSPARFFHVPGDPPFECFQVSVHLPVDGRTGVTARAIDTNDGTEHAMEQTWRGSTDELDEMLGAAVALIERWKARDRKAPDPPSPW